MNRSRVTGDLASHGNIFVDIANDRVGIGSTIPGQKLSLPDNAKIALGNSADLQISHDGSHSFLQNTTGLLILQDTSGIYLRTDDLRLQSDGGSETYATLTKNGAVSLNFDNNNRFQTKDYGAEVIGTTDTDGLIVSGITTFSNATTIVNGGYHRGIINSGAQAKIIGGYISGSDTLRLGESMYLTSTGLGINKSSPATKLHVVGGTASGTAYDTAVFAGGQNSTSGSGVKLYLSGCENNPTARGVILESIMTDNANAHRFSILVGGASAAPTERFRIDSTGQGHFYGNQSNAPQGIFGFRYDKNNDTDVSIENLNNSSVNNNAALKLRTNHGNIQHRYFNNGGFYIQNSSASGYLHYFTNNVSRFYIDSSGNVNINNQGTIATTNGNVGKRLGIKSTLNNIIIGETTNASMHGIIIESRVTGRSGGARCSQLEMGDGVIRLYTAPSGGTVLNRFNIGSDGTSTFDVGAPSSSNKVIGRFQAQSSRQLDIVWHDSGSLMGFNTPGNHSYIFKCNNTERLRIASAGQIGLGGANYGSSGQVLTSQGSGSAAQWATPSSGVSMVDEWRLSTNLTNGGSESYITSNWVRNSTNGFSGGVGVIGGAIGSAMSVSSGYFSFPSTGIYKVEFNINYSINDADTKFFEANIIGTKNNSTYTVLARSYGPPIHSNVHNEPMYGHAYTAVIFDVTNTSNCKFRLNYSCGTSSNTIIGGGYNATCVTVTRLGDT